jgi:hypothetical protein
MPATLRRGVQARVLAATEPGYQSQRSRKIAVTLAAARRGASARIACHLNPSGFLSCHRQWSSHIRSIPNRAFHPSTFAAAAGFA